MGSCLNTEIVQHGMGKMDKEKELLVCAVGLAFTSQAFEAAHETLHPDPGLAQLHGQYVGLALTMLVLAFTEKIIRYRNPEHIPQL
jgi:hypothetical protein